MPGNNICDPPDYPVVGMIADSDWIISGINMYSGVSGNIGIGTTTPQQKLDVAGSIQMTGFKLTTGITSGYVLTADAAGVGTWQAIPSVSAFDDLSDVTITALAAGHTLRYNGSAWVNNSALFNNGGNIGINNTSPARRLTVGDGTSSEDIMISSLSTGISRLLFNNGSSDRGGIAYNHASDSVTFNTAFSDRAIITNSGKFGIGTVTPTSLLEAKGSTADDTASSLSILDSAGVNILGARNDGHIAMNNIFVAGESGVVIGDLDLTTKEILRVVDKNAVNCLFVQQRTDGRAVGINSNTPQSTLDVAGSQSVAVRSVSTATTLTELDYILLCDLTFTFNVNLPDVQDAKKRIYIIKKTTGTGVVTMIPFGGNKIDGNTAYQFGAVYQKQSIMITNDGVNDWFIIAEFLT